MLPISLIETGINQTFNKSKNVGANNYRDLNHTKSSSRKKVKLNLKYCLMKDKNKRVNSYNNKRIVKKKDISKESESNIIYGDSEFDDDGEGNQTPKKIRDNAKINPIQLLGDFKKEFNIFNKYNKKLSGFSSHYI